MNNFNGLVQINEYDNQDFGKIRVLIDKNNDIWFIGKDVCDILGTETRDITKILDEDEYQTIAKFKESNNSNDLDCTIYSIDDEVRSDTYDEIKSNDSNDLDRCGYYPQRNNINRLQEKMIIINESGFYKLVMGSRKPITKSFQKWVTSVVLPSIRKTGSYSIYNLIMCDKDNINNYFFINLTIFQEYEL